MRISTIGQVGSKAGLVAWQTSCCSIEPYVPGRVVPVEVSRNTVRQYGQIHSPECCFVGFRDMDSTGHWVCKLRKVLCEYDLVSLGDFVYGQ